MEEWAENRPRDFEALVGGTLWEEYRLAAKEIAESLVRAQSIAERVKAKLPVELETSGAI